WSRSAGVGAKGDESSFLPLAKRIRGRSRGGSWRRFLKFGVAPQDPAGMLGPKGPAGWWEFHLTPALSKSSMASNHPRPSRWLRSAPPFPRRGAAKFSRLGSSCCALRGEGTAVRSAGVGAKGDAEPP